MYECRGDFKMKYFVASNIDSNHFILNEFDNLGQAYKFYLEDAAKRIIVKEVKPEVTERV